jgi:hypothetical protein
MAKKREEIPNAIIMIFSFLYSRDLIVVAFKSDQKTLSRLL